MVTFRLILNDERYIVYWYFPDSKEDRGHGIIMIDKAAGTIDITEIAPDDFRHEESVEEQNAMRDSVNEMRKEEMRAELTEEEWPSAKEPFVTTFFADHAVSKICKAYNEGVVLEEEMAMWYKKRMLKNNMKEWC